MVSSRSADHVDIVLGNFIVSADGVNFVDREWQSAGPVSMNLVTWRAMWWLAEEMIRRSTDTPWGSVIEVDDLCLQLCAAAGLDSDRTQLWRLRQAEAELQALVTGTPVRTMIERLDEIGARNVLSSRPEPLPIARLRTTVDALHLEVRTATLAADAARHGELEARASLTALAAELDQSRTEAARAHEAAANASQAATTAHDALRTREEARAALGRQVENLTDDLRRSSAQLDAVRRELDATRGQLDDARDQRDDARDQRDDARTQLDDARTQLDDAREQLDDAREQLDDARGRLTVTEDRLAAVEEHLAAFQQTRMVRWSRVPRGVWHRLRTLTRS